MKTIQASLRIALVAAVALGVASCSKKTAPTTAPDTSAGQSAQAPSSAPTQVVPSDSGFPTPAASPNGHRLPPRCPAPRQPRPVSTSRSTSPSRRMSSSP